MAQARAAGIQVLKRFTGGGTVVVDSSTVFATLIFSASALPGVDVFPQPIMRWTEAFYKHVFHDHHDFAMRENGARAVPPARQKHALAAATSVPQARPHRPLPADYVLGQLKFGGNAQAITGRRWLHHTSFLWDYDPAHMALLQHPRKKPKYRLVRAPARPSTHARPADPPGRPLAAPVLRGSVVWCRGASLSLPHTPLHLRTPPLCPPCAGAQERSHTDFLVPLKQVMQCTREQLTARIAQAAHAALPGFEIQVGAPRTRCCVNTDY